MKWGLSIVDECYNKYMLVKIGVVLPEQIVKRAVLKIEATLK